MRSPSKIRPHTFSKFSVSVMLLASISSLLITIYFLRYVQVLSLRKSMLQSRKISYIFTATSFSTVINNKNTLKTPQVLVQLPLEVRIAPGDTVKVIGSVETKLQPLQSERITVTSRSIHILNKHRSYGIPSIYDVLKLLEEIPRVLKTRLSGHLEPSQASLLVGMVFGGTEKLPKSVLEDMKTTGLTHITSASGFNVSLLIGFSLSLFTRVVNRRMAVIFCLITIISYSVMAGLTPPIIRASLMGSLYLLSLSLGKPYSVLRSLGLAIWIMLIYQPFLIYSVSFLLTVGSTLGIVWAPVLFPVKKRGTGVISQIWALLEENFKTTGSVMLFTAPVIISTFGTFSLVAPLANALLLWMVPLLTLVGMGFMGLTLISSLFSGILAWPVTILLEVFERSVRLFSNLPFASLPITGPSILGLFLWYLCLSAYLGWRMALNYKECQQNPAEKSGETRV